MLYNICITLGENFKMNIVILSDMFATVANGTSTAYKTLAKEMKKRGHNVTIIAPCEKDFEENGIKYVSVPAKNFYVLNGYVRKNGVILAHYDENIIEKNIKNADVVHLLLPFSMSRHILPLLWKLKIPYTSATHAQAENLTAHVGLQKWGFATKVVYNEFVKHFYKYVRFAHAPSSLMKNDLEEHGAKTHFKVITNGVNENFCADGTEKPPEYAKKFLIFSSGRFSREKRQDVIIKAVALSKHKNEIKLVLAGQGPLKSKYEKLIEKTGIDAEIDYFEFDIFTKLYKSCDLYVHASDIELEGISFLEAVTCGRPCVLSDSKRAAMRFYANKNSLFKAGNPKSLAQKIDYYFEHEKERLELGKWYLDHSDQFKLNDAMDQMEKMFEEAIIYYRVFYRKHPNLTKKTYKKLLKMQKDDEKDCGE